MFFHLVLSIFVCFVLPSIFFLATTSEAIVASTSDAVVVSTSEAVVVSTTSAPGNCFSFLQYSNPPLPKDGYWRFCWPQSNVWPKPRFFAAFTSRSDLGSRKKSKSLTYLLERCSGPTWENRWGRRVYCMDITFQIFLIFSTPWNGVLTVLWYIGFSATFIPFVYNFHFLCFVFTNMQFLSLSLSLSLSLWLLGLFVLHPQTIFFLSFFYLK